MKRSELYVQVWKTPMSRLARELGLSDVGLAKLCTRHDIPVPPRGYWAKLAAGKSVLKASLPAAADREVLSIPYREHHEQRSADAEPRRRVRHAQATVSPPPAASSFPVQNSLDNCLPIVARTAAFFREVQQALDEQNAPRRRGSRSPMLRFESSRLLRKEFGRYSSRGDGRLSIAATLVDIDWVLRFHDALLRSLGAAGCRVRADSDKKSTWVSVDLGGEAAQLSFAEEYTKVLKSPNDTAWTSWDQWDYIRRDTFKLKLARALGSMKIWSGTAPELEAALPDVVQGIVVILRTQAAKRVVVEAEAEARRAREAIRAEESRRWFAEQEARSKRRAARTAQLERAKLAGRDALEHEAMLRLLASLEQRCSAEDAGAEIFTWIELVRSMLRDPAEALLDQLRSEMTGSERPLWWPGEDVQ